MSLIFYQTLIFTLASLIVLGAAWFNLTNPEITILAIKPQITLKDFIIAFLFSTLFIFILLKVYKGALLFNFVFNLALGFGIFFIFASFLPVVLSGFISAFLIILNAVLEKLWIHNIAMLLGISGVSLYIGFSLSFKIAFVLLIILACYDMIAVWGTKHMILLFRDLAKRGVVLTFVLPQKVQKITTSLNKVKEGSDFLFLGGGDLAFPLLVAVSGLKEEGFILSIFIILGGFLGLIFGFFLFKLARHRKPWPALPFIVLGCSLSYLIYLFLMI